MLNEKEDEGLEPSTGARSKIENPKSKALLPLAAVFRMGVAVRGTAYQRGWLETRRLVRPVVSVGNISVGGTGKTPLVALIARLLWERGLKPGILTRGYGRRPRAKVVALVPQFGRTPDPREVGDEPALLARALPQVPIVVCADRYRGGRLAEERFNVRVHILDDGFQHLSLARDVDVVALDVTQGLLEQPVLPAGRLREPPRALQRAHMVVLTRTELADPGPMENQLREISPKAAVFLSRTRLRVLVDVRDGTTYSPEAFQAERVHAFCGIGNPRAFFANLRAWGFSVVAESAFADHHVYSVADLSNLTTGLKKSGADALVTTEKDAMNLPPLTHGDVPLFACAITMELPEARRFEEALVGRVAVAGATEDCPG